MPSKPVALITNDDGIKSPWLNTLLEAVDDLVDPLVVAPFKEQSSMGRAYFRGKNAGIIREHTLKTNGNTINAYSVETTPALLIGHAVLEIAKSEPAICLSGINPGENVGSSMMGSGTIMATLEASEFNMPGIAFSYQTNKGIDPNLQAIKKHARAIVESVLKRGLPLQTSSLNVNFPSKTDEKTARKVTKLSKQIYFEYLTPKKRDVDKPYDIPITRKYDKETLEEDSDIYTINEESKISITPISWDFTSHEARVVLADHLQI